MTEQNKPKALQKKFAAQLFHIYQIIIHAVKKSGTRCGYHSSGNSQIQNAINSIRGTDEGEVGSYREQYYTDLKEKRV